MPVPDPRPSTRVFLAFALLATAFAASVGYTLYREWRAEWRLTEARFDRLDRVRLPGAEERIRGLHQYWLPDLDRVDRCVSCHRGIDDPVFRGAPEPFAAHPGRWLDTHPPERFGCTACHGGQGEATTYTAAAHGRIPHWPGPMRHGVLVEAGCGTCHRERSPQLAPALAAGRATLAASGCVACHDIPGFAGEEVQAPRLENVGAKLRAWWMARYLDRPQVLPGARMPDFRLTAEETAGLVAFLRVQRTATAAVRIEDGDATGADVDRGREIFARARCVSCHRVDGRGGDLGPDLSTIGSRVNREWLRGYLHDPHAEQPDTRMPRFRFDDAGLRDLVSYLAEELTDHEAPTDDGNAPSDAALIERGRATFVRRACYSCHRFAGMTTLGKIGPTLAGIGERPIEEADMLGQAVTPTLPNWLYLKVQAPGRLGSATSLMPTYALEDEARMQVVVALLSLTRRDLPPARVTSDPPASPYRPHGAFGAVVERFRCLACHQAAGTGATLSTVALDYAGSRFQPDYLRSYMREPSTVRVHLETRMPRMHLNDQEATTVVDHAARVLIHDALESWSQPDSLAADRGRRLYDMLGCRGCHSIAGQGGYVGPDLSTAGNRLRPGWMQAWLRAPERWTPGTLQPNYGLSEADAQALAAYLLTLRASEGPGVSAGTPPRGPR
jgi:cytochrome c2/nitrate reductase cytochrome c-type subunit